MLLRRICPCRASPLKGKAKPRPVALERVVIDDDPNVGPLLPNFRDFGSIGFPRHRPVAAFVMADVVVANASRHQVKLTFVPNSFPSVVAAGAFCMDA
jgi:hypothetical protein